MYTARQTSALPGATFFFWLMELSASVTCQVRLTLMRGALRRLPTKIHRRPSTLAAPSSMVQIPSGPIPLLSPMKLKGAK